MTKYIQMTKGDDRRADIIKKVLEKRLTWVQAHKMIGVTYRHFCRLKKRYKKNWLAGIINKNRGKPSNRRLKEETENEIRELVKKEEYTDFGPTFMTEKLKELHDIDVSSEKTRQLMIQEWTW